MRSEISKLGEQVAGLLRSAPDPFDPVEGVDWTVAQVGAHLVDVARRNQLVPEGKLAPYPRPGEDGGGMAAWNARNLEEEVTERKLGPLAETLVKENHELLNAYGLDGDRRVQWYDIESTVRQAGAIWMGELLIHGLDLARTLKRAWPIRPVHAVAVFEGLLPVFPVVVDPEQAPQAVGTYHVRLRGGGNYTFTVDNEGDLTIETGKPRRADLHISASPVPYLLVGYGRIGQWGPIARGQIRAWGRKPWLATRFTKLFVRP